MDSIFSSHRQSRNAYARFFGISSAWTPGHLTYSRRVADTPCHPRRGHPFPLLHTPPTFDIRAPRRHTRPPWHTTHGIMPAL